MGNADGAIQVAQEGAELHLWHRRVWKPCGRAASDLSRGYLSAEELRASASSSPFFLVSHALAQTMDT